MAAIQPDKRPPVNKAVQERIIDFSGGQNSTISGGLLNKSEAQKAHNISLEQKGTILPARGRKKRYTVPFATQPCTGLSGYYKKDGTSRLLLASGDKVYADKPHLSFKWDTQADFEKTGTERLGFADTSKKPGSVTLDKYTSVFIHECEDTARFVVKDSILTNDTANAYYLDKCIKLEIALSKTIGYAKVVKGTADLTLDPAKYYLVTAMIKNGIANSGIRLVTLNASDVSVKTGTYVTGTAYVQTSMKLAPADITALTSIAVDVGGTAGQYAYFDGFMILEISEADYNNSSYVVPRLNDVIAVKEKITWDTDVEWNSGVKTNVLASSNSLQLAYSSPSFSHLDTLTADWSGTKANVVATADKLALAIATTSATINSTVISQLLTTWPHARPQVLSNGWIVVCVANGTYSVNFYVSKNNGATWALLCYGSLGYTISDVAFICKDTRIYAMAAYANTTIRFYEFDALTISAGAISTYTTVVNTETAIEACSIAISIDGASLTMAWSCKNATYISGYAIRAKQGVINADYSITWGSIAYVAHGGSGVECITPYVMYSNNNTLKVIYVYKPSSTQYVIMCATYSGGVWDGFNSAIYNPGSGYTQITPSVTVQKYGTNAGRIWVTWTGGDSGEPSYNIRVSYSDDNGVTWSAMQKLTTTNNMTSQEHPSITSNDLGHIFILYHGRFSGSYNQIWMLKYTGTWANTCLTPSNTNNIAMPSIGDNYYDFDQPIAIWQDTQVSAVKASGIIGSTTYYTSGTYTSPIFIADVPNINSSNVTFNSTTTGGTLTVKTNVSLDAGVTWIGWKIATNNTAIADVPTGVVTNDIYIKYMVEYTSTDGKATPVLNDIKLSITPTFASNGTWISPDIDLSKSAVGTSNVTYAATLNGGTVQLEIRALRVDGTWTDYITQPNNSSLVSIGDKVQYRFTFTPSDGYINTPSVSSLETSITPSGKRGAWISDPMDVSTALSKSLGTITISADVLNGQLVLYSRSKANTADEWSLWIAALADGTLRHPENNFVQIRTELSGSVSLNDVTVAFDGDPAAEVILSGMTPDAEYDFTTLRDKVIIANGHDAMRKWDAVDAPSLLSGAPPVMKMIETHHNRVWGVEFDNPSRVRYSDILDPETWGVLNFIDFNPEDGDAITALYRYGQNLIVSKRRSMALLTGNMSSNYSVVWLDSEQGATGMRAIVQADKYIAYVSYDGIRFTDLNTSVLATERLLPDWENVNHKRLNQACMVYWKNQLLVALPSKDSIYNDQVWIFDFLRNAWSIRYGWNISAFSKFHQYGEEILLATDSTTGQVYNVMTFTRYDDTAPVSYTWKSKRFDFGYPERYKLFKNIFLDIEGITEENTLTVDLIVDDVVVGVYTTAIPAGEGTKHTRRILPPLYNAVLGKNLTLEVKGRCGIQAITIEYIVRGVVPTEEI